MQKINNLSKGPLISIITPNFNYSQYVGQTIESVLDQNYPYIEHIIVDDGSTDDSVNIIKNYVNKYPERIKLIIQENSGQTKAINNGLQHSNGDIIGWINSDDTYCKNIFANVINFFINNPHVNILFGDVNVVDDKGRFIYKIRHLPFDYMIGVFEGFAKIITSNAVFWRRRVMQNVGFFNSALVCNMDGEYFSRLTKNEKVVHLTLTLSNFRKQQYSKAALKNNNWKIIVKKEIKFEQINSYNKLKVSCYIPYKLVFPIKSIFRIKRITLRLLRMHYILKYIEIYKYIYHKS